MAGAYTIPWGVEYINTLGVIAEAACGVAEIYKLQNKYKSWINLNTVVIL